MKPGTIAAALLALGTFLPGLALAQTTTVGAGFPGASLGVTSSIVTSTSMSSTTDAPVTPGAPPSSSSNRDDDDRDLRCTPSDQSVATGEVATVRVRGGNGTYSLSAPGFTTVNTRNNRFSFTFSTPGGKTVVVTSDGQSDACEITVTGAALASAGATEADQVAVEAATEETAARGNWPWIALIVILVLGLGAWAVSRTRKAV